MVKALPIDVIWKKRVIRGKIIREGWMNDNGLNNVMELIKRQKWENLFKRRELVHTDAVKEFYAKMTVMHLKKKDIVKSKVRGVEIEFDHEKLATILGIPGTMGSREYVKDVWEESKYIKPLEITVSGENRRRDDDEAAPEEEAEGEDEGNQVDFDWEAVIDEATVEGESGSGEKFYDAEEDAQGSPELPDEIPADTTTSSVQQKDKGIAGVDPSGPTSREADFLKFQRSLNERGQTNFMMNWRRPKLRMPNF
ncbi:hypothetical protein Dimus_022205 [Dionaea muscipula]